MLTSEPANVVPSALECNRVAMVTWAGCSRRPPPCSLPSTPAWRWRSSCRCKRRRRPRLRWLTAERPQDYIITPTTTHSETRRRTSSSSSSSPRSWSCPDTSSRTCPRPWWWCGGSWGTERGGRAWPGSGWSAAGRSRRSRCTAGSCYWRCAAPSPPPAAAGGAHKFKLYTKSDLIWLSLWNIKNKAVTTFLTSLTTQMLGSSWKMQNIKSFPHLHFSHVCFLIFNCYY